MADAGTEVEKSGDDAGAKRSALAALAVPVSFVGARGVALLEHIGAIGGLTFETLRWIYRAFTRKRVRMGVPAIMSQIVRVGVRSLLIVSLVSGCVGLILVLQMAPPLDQFGRRDLVANIVGVAILRELGPLIAAIVLTGFAGAAIAAELGTMVVGEEIEALEAQALNPIRFLVIPRVLATVISLMCLSVASNVVAIGCGMLIALLALEIPVRTFWENLLFQAKAIDFVTGFTKSIVFGALIGLIACTNGLRVTGGAAGVGKATTDTVVQSIVAIVVADLIFTAVFFAWKLN
ncbi:MAG: ABC transporter permease [Phycisphaerales bacterium]|jgi:phospholipid/cholesterol/gamma-HCH transport system permease protein|nr:ABC transporter permease [Phycisphaerales bacterium]